jgi:DinB superfamily
MNEYDISILGSGPFPEYVKYHLDNLNGRDPVPVREQAREQYARLITGLTDEQLTRPEKPEKWSIAGVFRHLADTELTFVYRMKLACTVDRPEVPPVEADVWAKALDYWNVDPRRAVGAYMSQSVDTTDWYQRLSDEMKRREFIHEEIGPQSVAIAYHMLASHDELHLKQVARILTTVQ